MYITDSFPLIFNNISIRNIIAKPPLLFPIFALCKILITIYNNTSTEMLVLAGTALLQCPTLVLVIFVYNLCLHEGEIYLLQSSFHKHGDTTSPHFHAQFFAHMCPSDKKQQGMPLSLDLNLRPNDVFEFGVLWAWTHLRQSSLLVSSQFTLFSSMWHNTTA